MNDSDAEVLGQVAKAIHFFANDKITAQELMWKFTDYLAAQNRVPTHLASQMVALMPDSVQLLCRNWIATVLDPAYRKGAWAGIRYATPEDEAAQSAMLTARVKTWAEALLTHL